MEDFFAGLETDGQVLTEGSVIDLSNEQQESTEPAESQTETEGAEEAPSHQGAEEPKPEVPNTDDDNNVPLNKNPRFQEVIAQRQEAERLLAERTAELERLKAAPEAVPDWFKEAYGEDANAWSVQQRVIQETAERVKREMIESEQKKVQAQQEHQARWDRYVADQVAELEGEGKKFDKNELLKIALEYQPTDAQGNVSLKKSYDILEMRRQAVKEDKVAPKKAVAALSSAPSRQAQPAERDYLTAADLRGKSFRDLIK